MRGFSPQSTFEFVIRRLYDSNNSIQLYFVVLWPYCCPDATRPRANPTHRNHGYHGSTITRPIHDLTTILQTIPNSHHRSTCYNLQNPNIAYLLILASPPANHVLHPLAPQTLPQNAPLPAPLAHRVARLPNHGPT